ncbi:MAG: Rpn family recombination-promoting nuclease/putative transposase [Anaerovoracaceae bacterium]
MTQIKQQTFASVPDAEHYHNLYQSLNLSDDFLFGKVMQDEEILQMLLEKILGFPIKKVVLIQPQKVLEIDPSAHGIRLDVYADDGENTRYCVEMQKSNQYNVPKRSRYYLSVMDLDQLEKGADYRNLKRSFVIFICLFQPFHVKRQKFTFERRCIEEEGLSLEDESSVIVLTDAPDSGGDRDIDAFFRYVVSSTGEVAESSESDFVRRIHQRVLEVKNNRNLEVEFVKLRELERENYEAGRLEMQRTVVQNMIALGMEDDEICRIAGCTAEFAAAVRAEESGRRE